MALLFNAKQFTIDVITDLQALLAFMDTNIKYINAIWDTLGYPEKKLAME